MKSINFLIIMLFTLQLFGQNFSCDKYRKIMDEEMDAMGFADKEKIFIIGKDGQYYKTGMSNHFISEPKVPNFIYKYDNFNPHMAKIIVAHVDLYHCDLVEKELTKNRSAQKLENEIEINIFPNPTSGNFNIESKHQINEVVVFNSSGSLIQLIDKVDEQINLSDLAKGIYYLQISTASGNTVKRVILE